MMSTFHPSLYDLQEEEEKESLAWKVLSEEQTQALKELTARELEAYVQQVHYKLTIRETICCLIFWSQLDLCWSYKKCRGQSPELR